MAARSIRHAMKFVNYYLEGIFPETTFFIHFDRSVRPSSREYCIPTLSDPCFILSHCVQQEDQETVCS